MKYLLFITPEPPLPVAILTIEAHEKGPIQEILKAKEIAEEALDTWVRTGKQAGFSPNRPKAYLVPDCGEWIGG